MTCTNDTFRPRVPLTAELRDETAMRLHAAVSTANLLVISHSTDSFRVQAGVWGTGPWWGAWDPPSIQGIEEVEWALFNAQCLPVERMALLSRVRDRFLQIYQGKAYMPQCAKYEHLHNESLMLPSHASPAEASFWAPPLSATEEDVRYPDPPRSVTMLALALEQISQDSEYAQISSFRDFYDGKYEALLESTKSDLYDISPALLQCMNERVNAFGLLSNSENRKMRAEHQRVRHNIFPRLDNSSRCRLKKIEREEHILMQEYAKDVKTMRRRS